MLVPDWQESTNRYPRRWPNEVDEFLTLVDPPVSVCELLFFCGGLMAMATTRHSGYAA